MKFLLMGAAAWLCLAPFSAEGADLPAPCRAKIDSRVPGWRLITPSPEVAAWAKEMKEGGDMATYRIAVCMQRKAGPELHIIDDPYCTDGIMIARKGTRAHNFETEAYVTYRTNGVHAYCFEKAGATYLYRGGRFIRIIDSD